VSIQPFFGARMISTRHLVLTKMDFSLKPPEARRVDGSSLIEEGDLPHLWMLTAVPADDRIRRASTKNDGSRIVDRSSPCAILAV
jgi:hypothetical protein